MCERFDRSGYPAGDKSQPNVDRGAIVDAVSSGGPADAAGFRGATGEEDVDGVAVARGGDVVVAIDGVPVTTADDLVRIVTNRLLPGRVATFSVVRGDKRLTIAVRLAERPSRQAPR